MSFANKGSILSCKIVQFLRLRTDSKRYRYKKKWASNLKHKDVTELALDHFDLYYRPVYGKLWPSIRVALLSAQKYCALVNNYHLAFEDCAKNLRSDGAYNFLRKVNKQKGNKETNLNEENPTVNSDSSVEEDLLDGTREATHVNSENFEQLLVNDVEVPNSGLNEEPDLHSSFIPAKQMFSEKQLLKQSEIETNIYEPRDIQPEIIDDKEKNIPEHLRAFVFPQGNVTDFPTPKTDKSGLLEYYLMDAASILPVVALNPSRSDRVLDLCSAPGGKLLTMLQTSKIGEVLANDISWSRLNRLTAILHWYCPEMLSSVKKSQADGRSFTTSAFDKVLVDVPCYTDRHVLMTVENNLFKPGRLDERLQIINLQKQLLLAGIKSCKEGGSIVYSTCTLSPTQNDGVIQAVIEELWNKTNINIAIEDISWMRNAFNPTFRFFDGCRFGQLVLPTLRANFGPMYFCKLKRLN